MFNYGFKLVINASLFINQLTNSNNNSQKSNSENEDIYSLVTVNEIPEATNSASINIKGTTSRIDKIAVYLNQARVKNIVIKNDSFNFTLDGLEKGINNLYLAGIKNDKTVKKTSILKVDYNDNKPKLEIKEPNDNAKTSNQEIKVEGDTDPNNNVEINHQPVVTNSQGHFTTAVKLSDGDNSIVISATNIYGSREEKTLKITYKKDD
jgi:bacillopeptidase F